MSYRAMFSAYSSSGVKRATFSVALESDNWKDAWGEAQDVRDYEGEGVELDDVVEVL